MNIKHLTIICFLMIGFFANAQKLPEVQTVNLRAPAGIKIDGKPTEWDSKFQAYNKSTNAFYTIANDDDNLYKLRIYMLLIKFSVPESHL